MPPRWQPRLYLNLLPLTRTTHNSSWIRHDLENPRTQGWGWNTHRTAETKTDHLSRIYERSPLSLWFLQWKIEEWGWGPSPHSIVSCFMGAPTVVSPHRGCRGICGAQALGIWLECRMRPLRRGDSRMRLKNYIVLYLIKNKRFTDVCDIFIY